MVSSEKREREWEAVTVKLDKSDGRDEAEIA